MRWLRLLAALPFLVGAAVPDPLAISDGQVKDGKGDVAVIIAVQDYQFVQHVPGAESNAVAWQRYLSEVRGVPVVKLLRGLDVTRENVLEQVSALASTTSGRAWLVFVGHGAPSYDPERPDARLLMMDAQQTDKSIMSRSLGRKELLDAVGSKRPEVVAVIDACYSGSFADGAPKVEGQPTPPVSSRIGTRATVLTAAEANQIAGEIPGHGRPAFSWLVLGGLRGWADADGSRTVTASELTAYATSTLTSVLTSRVQTPTLEAVDEGVVLSRPTRPADAPVLVAPSAAGGPVARPGTVRAEPVVAVDGGFDPVEALRQQTCQNDANAKAAGARDERLASAAKARAAELATAWRGLSPKLEACSRLEDAGQRKACEPLVTSFLSAAEAAVSVSAGGETVATECGDRTGSALAAERRVEVPEVEAAKAALSRLRAGPGAVSGAVVRHVVKGVAFEGVVVPAGTFTMGSPASEAGRYPDEKQVQVTLTRGFEVMKTEVTQGLYAAVMGKNPSKFSSCGATCPVENVSWDDAVAFAKALNAAEGVAAGTWRLPTEAEWEWAARGGERSAWAGASSEEAVCGVANIGNERRRSEYNGMGYDASGWVLTGCDDGFAGPAPAGSFRANGYGVVDMGGNVWEWVSDRYGASLSGGRDPTGPDAGDNRVRRGGGWNFPAQNARVAYRSRSAPDYRYDSLGFRLVRSTLVP